MTRIETKLVHLGRTSGEREQAVNPPLVRASTTLFETIADMRSAREDVPYTRPRYGLYGTTTTFELQDAMAELCGVEGCLATASGLSAVAAVLGAHARPGSRVLIQDEAYEPTRSFAETELARDCDVRFFGSVDRLRELLTEDTAIVLVEVPTSSTMRLIDVREVASLTRAAGVPLACDATWGTPLYFDAHGLGVDISIHAATKYIGGHSDIMLGLVTGSDAALARTREWSMHHGVHAAPDVCWLALRGLRTLSVRMERHRSSALEVATWLEAQPQVERVLFPALESDPDHELWRELFSGAAGLFSIELRACSEDAYAQMIESLRLFHLGASWGGFESLAVPATSHRQRSAELQSDDGRLVRLHIGLEDPADLVADLQQALRHV